MLAMIGPSGSGKSTLLKTLFQRLDRKKYDLRGNVKFNGEDAENVSMLREYIGFIPQNEEFLNSLSVDATLSFIGDLTLSHFSIEERIQRVNDLLFLKFFFCF